jgi:hypothetical protein
MKKAKANYLPRLTKGVTFYEGAASCSSAYRAEGFISCVCSLSCTHHDDVHSGPLRESIDEGDWDAVTKAVKEKGAAWNLAHVDKYSSGVVGEVQALLALNQIRKA